MSIRSLILVLVSTTMASAAAAQTTPNEDTVSVLETVTVAGLRPVAVDDVTTSITVLSAADLAVRDNPYLADQLRAVPGVGLSRSGPAGGLSQIRIRGAEANHTLVLIDGIEVSDPTTGETDFGLFSGLYPARVEVARGEQSALYGSDAIGGVVNIVTGDQAGFRGLLEGGSRNTVRLDAGFGVDFDAGDLQFAFADVISDGVDTSGRGGEEDGYQNYSGIVSGGYQFNPHWQIHGLARYAYGEVDTDPDLDFDGQLDNADRVTESAQWTLGGSLDGDAFGVNHSLRASYNQVERENFGDGASLNVSDADRTKLSYSPSREIALSGAALRLTGLVEWEQEDYSAEDTEFGGFTNQDQTFETLGLAAEAHLDIDQLHFTASVRQDDNDGQFDDATTWRLGGAYSFQNGTRLRASAGTGVKNPTFTELFGFFPGSFIGNADLKPESSTSWEIGVQHTSGPVQLAATYFEATLEDEIFTQFTPSFFATPANCDGDSDRSGIEAELAWAVRDNLSLRAAVSNISSLNDAGDDEIRVPEWTGSVALDWQSQQKAGLKAGLAADYVGEQLDTDFGSFPFSNVSLDPYWLVSATAAYPLTERVSLTLRGENLLDETVTDVLGFEGPGAGLFIGIRIR